MSVLDTELRPADTHTDPVTGEEISHDAERQRDLPAPEVRPLRVYAFDPSEGRYRGNQMTLNVRYEDLQRGPIGRRIAVIDYDGERKVFYKPVDLDDPRVLIRDGLDPSESDPRFHQQMVYAVVSDTIASFEAALGRRLHWRLDERHPNADGVYPGGRMPGDIWRLNLYPHAMIAANAAYVPAAKGILFGYFQASEVNPGKNLPGQTIFTCLSHDVIVHETTHALLDGMRRNFMEATNPEVGAFHEAFADIAALFRHFSHKEALLDTIQKTGGRLYKYQLQPNAGTTPADEVHIEAEVEPANPLIELARQFGEARGTGKALRSALGARDPNRIRNRNLEAHERGSILVSAVFDAFFSTYIRETADVFRLFRSGGGSVDTVELPASMANLLAKAATRTAERFFRICARAIDYCPPVDIRFGDYLRAVITADRELYPVDELGIRDAFMQAFRARGILPEDAAYFSEDALCWQPAQSLPPIENLIFGDPRGLTPAEKNHDGPILRAYVKEHARALGLRQDLADPIVPSFHPIFRVQPDGTVGIDMVVETYQRCHKAFDERRPELGTFPMPGGATLLIRKVGRGHASTGIVSYAIKKSLDDVEGRPREERQRAWGIHRGLVGGSDPKRFHLDFNMLHGGDL